MSIVRPISQYKVIKIGVCPSHSVQVHNKTVHYDSRFIKKKNNVFHLKNMPHDYRIILDNDRMTAPTEVAWESIVGDELSTRNLESFLQQFLYVTFVINIQFIFVIQFFIGILHSDVLINHYEVSSYRLMNNAQQLCSRFAGNFRIGGFHTLSLLAEMQFILSNWISYTELLNISSLIYNPSTSVAVENRMKLVADAVSQDLLFQTLFDEIKNQHAGYDDIRVDIDVGQSRLFAEDYDTNNKDINDLLHTYVFYLVFRIFLPNVLFAVFFFCYRRWQAYEREQENVELQRRVSRYKTGDAFKYIDIVHSKFAFALFTILNGKSTNIKVIIEQIPRRVTHKRINELNCTFAKVDEGWQQVQDNMRHIYKNSGLHREAQSMSEVKSCRIERKCNYCGTASLPLRKCHSCKMLYFCSRRCQKLDWRTNYVHKYYCARVSDINVNLMH